MAQHTDRQEPPGGKIAAQIRRPLPSQPLRKTRITEVDASRYTTDKTNRELSQMAPQKSNSVVKAGERNDRLSGSLRMSSIVESQIEEERKKRQKAKLQKLVQELVGSEEAPGDTPESDLDLDHQTANDRDHASRYLSSVESLDESEDEDEDDADSSEEDSSESNGGLDIVNDPLANDIESENSSEEEDLQVESEVNEPSNQPTTAHTSMTRQETKWWAMSFDKLYLHARSKGYGKGKESRKSGRIYIIKWLCKNAGIKPYAAPTITPVAGPTHVVATPVVRPTGAISHPEAILRTNDPELQRKIDEKEKYYRTWTAASLLTLAMQRSYQLLKDSNGKLPSKSLAAMSNWLASWDVLKSPREKKWWLGDGINLVNKAKAMGYQGPSKKYDVILWLRNTPEDAEIEVAATVAEPTPVSRKEAMKRKAEDADLPVSRRPAKGSKRPDGWSMKIWS